MAVFAKLALQSKNVENTKPKHTQPFPAFFPFCPIIMSEREAEKIGFDESTDMEFIKHVEVDKGPVVRFFANKLSNLGSWLIDKTHAYAEMYTAVWDDYEEDDKNDSSTWDTNYHHLLISGPNQMVQVDDTEEDV